MEKKYCLLMFVLVYTGLFLLGCRPHEELTEIPSVTTESISNEDAEHDSKVVSEAQEFSGQPTNQDLAINEILTSFDNLSFDEFLDATYKEILLRDPEGITENGLSAAFKVDNSKLTNISANYLQDTYELYRGILEKLQYYEDVPLTDQQELSKKTYTWYLEDFIASEDYKFHNYLVTFFITAVQVDLEGLLTDLHTISNKKDAEDLIARLMQVDVKFRQLIENLAIQEELGIIPPKMVIQWTLDSIRQIANSEAKNTEFYRVFESKVRALSNVLPNETTQLLSQAEEAISQHVIPAYQKLLTVMEKQESFARSEIGVGELPDGEAYYHYLVQHYTTTRITPENIFTLGTQELERVHAEMREVFDELGYPPDISLLEGFNRVAKESGFIQNKDILQKYESIIQDAEYKARLSFNLYPSTSVIVKPDTFGGYYIPPSLDGRRPGAFYATIQGELPFYGMPTLAYHEAVPGHHLQIGIARDLALPLFMNLTDFTGYVEGWALYAERLAWELGWYDDPYINLGRLQGEAFRAARLVVDPGIHTKGWTFEQAVNFFMENTGYDRDFATMQIARYVVWPGQSTAYMVGMLKILELRQMVQEQLGPEFDLGEFHQAVLENGSLPLDILEEVIRQYIEKKQAIP